MLIGPVLIAGVKLCSIVEPFYCFFDAALTHVLHEKSEKAPVNLAHAVIVFQCETRVIKYEVLALFEVDVGVENPQVIDLSEHGQISDIDLRTKLPIINHIVFLGGVHRLVTCRSVVGYD